MGRTQPTVDKRNSTDRSDPPSGVRLTAELLGKSLVIGAAIAALMIGMQFRLSEVALVSTTAALAAMMMAIAEYDAIAADRDGSR